MSISPIRRKWHAELRALLAIYGFSRNRTLLEKVQKMLRAGEPRL